MFYSQLVVHKVTSFDQLMSPDFGKDLLRSFRCPAPSTSVAKLEKGTPLSPGMRIWARTATAADSMWGSGELNHQETSHSQERFAATRERVA